MQLSERIEYALELCGRDRVFHNECTTQIAIRWKYPSTERKEIWLVGQADTYDQAGENVATEYAHRLQQEGEALIEQSERIIKALKNHGKVT
jgi:hypothetical protein